MRKIGDLGWTGLLEYRCAECGHPQHRFCPRAAIEGRGYAVSRGPMEALERQAVSMGLTSRVHTKGRSAEQTAQSRLPTPAMTSPDAAVLAHQNAAVLTDAEAPA